MIVIHASVAIKLLINREPDAYLAEKLLEAHIEGREKIIVPSLLYLEVTNVLVTKSGFSRKDIEEGLHLLNEFEFTIHRFSKTNLIDTTIMATKYQTTVYDMLYAVVAKEEKCTLVTADEQFIKKT